MMKHIQHINITNFKSIRDLKLENCRRINLFIGYPNVGKSNILEALSLFSVPFLKKGENLTRFVRAENKNELFYNASEKEGEVKTNLTKVILENDIATLRFFFEEADVFHPGCRFTNNLEMEYYTPNFKERGDCYKVKRYLFSQATQWKSIGQDLLLPPFGENIIDVLSYSTLLTDMKIWMKKEFSKFGLEYVLDKSSSSIKTQRRLGNDEIMLLPYSSMADTLQRVIFYKTAIASNKDSILLFEEPEAHAFPPYIKSITQDIINSTTNQFFIATHSNIIVNDFLEYDGLRKDVAIYLIDFKDGQTSAKRLSDEEVNEVYNDGEDLFFNIEKFL
ncbi:MAG: AAA family ATPase [Prevotellaceae bacterium]|jgi:AAA15 family ATPase/GTPase|nr:AAA family ATPase [Prevotellaceae bacterium]